MRLLVLVIFVIFVFFAVTDVGAKKIVLPSLDFPQGKSMRQEEVKQPDFEFDHHTYDFGKFSKKKKQQHIFTFEPDKFLSPELIESTLKVPEVASLPPT